MLELCKKNLKTLVGNIHSSNATDPQTPNWVTLDSPESM